MNEAELSALRLAHAKEIADVELRRAQDVNRWAERVVEREKEVEGLQAQLAARPLNRDLESLEHVTDLYGRSLGEWRELSAWIESRVAPLPGERLTLVEMVKHAAMVYAAPQELVYAAPLSPSAPAHDAYTKAAVEYAEACVRAYCGPTFNRVAESGTNYAAFKALYDARKRGEQVTEKEKPAPHQPETVDVWLAQYADGQIYSMPEGLHGVASHQTATRFLRVRLPVVEVVENEKGGA